MTNPNLVDGAADPVMGLLIPVPLVDPGPDYASNVSYSLIEIASHSHLPGSGVYITTAALNINADLPFNGWNAYGLRTVRFTNLSASPNGAHDVGCAYELAGDLWWNNASGTPVQITNGYSLAPTPTSLSFVTAPQGLWPTSGGNTLSWITYGGFDFVPVNCQGATVDITLPAASGAPSFGGYGRFFWIQDATGLCSVANPIVISTSGSDALNSEGGNRTTYTIAGPWEGILIWTDASSNWNVLPAAKKVFDGETVSFVNTSTLSLVSSTASLSAGSTISMTSSTLSMTSTTVNWSSSTGIWTAVALTLAGGSTVTIMAAGTVATFVNNGVTHLNGPVTASGGVGTVANIGTWTPSISVGNGIYITYGGFAVVGGSILDQLVVGTGALPGAGNMLVSGNATVNGVVTAPTGNVTTVNSTNVNTTNAAIGNMSGTTNETGTFVLNGAGASVTAIAGGAVTIANGGQLNTGIQTLNASTQFVQAGSGTPTPGNSYFDTSGASSFKITGNVGAPMSLVLPVRVGSIIVVDASNAVMNFGDLFWVGTQGGLFISMGIANSLGLTKYRAIFYCDGVNLQFICGS